MSRKIRSLQINQFLPFNVRLKRLRELTNMRQEELASILNVNQRTISNWEKGMQEPSLSNIKKIAMIFKVSSDYLLGLDTPTRKAIDKLHEQNIEDMYFEKFGKKLPTQYNYLDVIARLANVNIQNQNSLSNKEMSIISRNLNLDEVKDVSKVLEIFNRDYIPEIVFIENIDKKPPK